MFSSLDKALVAIVMGLLYFAVNVFGLSIPDEWIGKVEGIIVMLTPFLVYLIPNKPK